MTDLHREILALIKAEGPIGIDRYMALCLTHPTLGYYVSRDPLGAEGDFTTAPEISQMFGELIGVWVLLVWQAMGRPSPFDLVELGPGRGTLMADILRVACRDRAFLENARVRLIELSPALKARQRTTLRGSGAKLSWHRSVDELAPAPSIIVANEFFDALPIRQYRHAEGDWREVMVGLNADSALTFTSQTSAPHLANLPGEDGQVLEVCETGMVIIGRLSKRVNVHGGALLAIDYGYAGGERGDTLQAVRKHRRADVLAQPGEVDLTAHVDFQALLRVAEEAGARTHPVLSQRTLLLRLGMEERAQALIHANAARRDDVEAALQRLMGVHEGAMGALFKAIAITHPTLVPPAFDAMDPLLESGLP